MKDLAYTLINPSSAILFGSRSKTWFCLLAALIWVPLILTGQETALQDEDEEEEEEVFELSPFEVSVGNDRGYRATNTTAGTSLNVEIRNLPMNVDVVTREFIEDVGATDFREALTYSAGVYSESFQNTSAANSQFRTQDRSPSASVRLGDEFNNSISIRGYNVPNQQRLGFRIGALVPAYGVVLGGNTDTVNTARQEVVRGPQSLLYGINVLSGIVNIIPQRPLSDRRTWVQFVAGSYDNLRFTFNHTGPLIKDKLNYRIMTAQDRRGDWEHDLEWEREYYAAQLEWFIGKNHKLFLEGQYTDSVRKGGGAKYYTDNASTLFDFHNKWSERYSFGRDFFNEQVIDPDAFEGVSDQYGDVSGRPYLIQQTDREYSFPDLGDRFRITGPDTRRWETEKNFLALYTGNITENLFVEAGAYITENDILERKVDIRTVLTDTAFTPSPTGGRAWPSNPEVAPFWNSETNRPVDSENWPIGLGPGELFVRDDPDENFYIPSSNRLFATYMWYETPTSSESAQYRGRIGYEFETEGLNGWFDGEHTISGGINYTKDKVSFLRGGPDLAGNYNLGTQQENWLNSRLEEDGLYLRSSLFDYSPLRYTDDINLAIPGSLRFGGLGEEYIEGLNAAVARSGHLDVDLWFRGMYSVYHGRFWKDRLHVIAGLREDRYQVKESEQLRVLDNFLETDLWRGGNPTRRMTPYLIGYGDKPFTGISELPDSLNQRVANSVDLIREARPNGTTDYNFENAEKYTTKTFGLNYRISKAFSGYYFYSEGIFPNTGQRDGSYNAIPAEQTTSNEIGLKFDLIEGKLSGQVSVFRIERENAVWFWREAPAPGNWLGGPGSSTSDINDFQSFFSPDAVRQGLATINYGVQEAYVIQAYEELGIEYPAGPRGPIAATFSDLGVKSVGQSPVGPNRENKIFFWTNYDEMKAADTADSPNPIRMAMDLAIRDKEAFDPLAWQYGQDVIQGYNASRGNFSGRGANVRFEEEGNGFDGNLIYSPVPNYQIIFNFSYQKREVTGAGFILEPGYQLDQMGNRVDDRIFTTEYDRWVRILGPENFEDPTRPETLKGGAIEGIDLSFVPNWSFRIWNKYQFTDGWMEGIEIGAGIRGNGSVATTVPIGGINLSENAFPTPDVPERFVGDAMISYRHQGEHVTWTLRLNVFNIFAPQIVNQEVAFTREDGESEFRRTRIINDPAAYRISLGMAF